MGNRVELTKSQREWIYTRADQLSEWTNTAHYNYEIHHIRPVGWQVYNFNEHPEEYNSPYRLILLGKEEHHQIHPDVPQALERYRRGDKKAFEKIFKHRRTLMEQGKKYWITTWDESFLQTAHRRTVDFMRAGNPWPTRRVRWV